LNGKEAAEKIDKFSFYAEKFGLMTFVVGRKASGLFKL
jgi:hypothetical protein